jgi:signal peptidase II
MARFWKLLVMICFLIIADQLTKGWVQTNFLLGQSRTVIEGFFNFTYVQNTGAAFGMGGGASEFTRKLMFLLLPTVFSVWVFWMLVTTIKGPRYMSFAYALILAGAVGNLIDRYTLGYVVDFLQFYYWPEKPFHVFNVADACITVAGFLLVIDVILQARAKRRQPNPPATN